MGAAAAQPDLPLGPRSGTLWRRVKVVRRRIAGRAGSYKKRGAQRKGPASELETGPDGLLHGGKAAAANESMNCDSVCRIKDERMRTSCNPIPQKGTGRNQKCDWRSPKRGAAERTCGLSGPGMGDADEAVMLAPSISRQQINRVSEVSGRSFRNRHLGPWFPWDGLRITPGHLINRRSDCVGGAWGGSPGTGKPDVGTDCWSRGLQSVDS